ncbi:MAG: hypothetical protein E7537_00670 [Ruminococcaceae bacterium]|nr:hypothetical protein [Oscillospiraceae bacterium]
MFFHRKDNKNNDGLVFVASIMPAFSGVYCEILKENGIPFINREHRTGGYLRIVTGGLLIPDDFYVNESDYKRAFELYKAFIEPELEE